MKKESEWKRYNRQFLEQIWAWLLKDRNNHRAGNRSRKHKDNSYTRQHHRLLAR